MAQIHTSREVRRNGSARTFSGALAALALAGLLGACGQAAVSPRTADSAPAPAPSPTPPPTPTPTPPPGGGTVDTTPPTAPGTLVASTDGPFGITVSWVASTDNTAVTGYRVERCLGAGCATFAQVATPTATNFSDTGLSSSTSYTYRVRATDAAANLSTYSNSATGATSSAPPPPLATLPAWVNALSVGQWLEIPNTSIRSVDPAATPAGNTGPRSKIDTWTSIGVDTRTSKVYSIAAGGHSDYSGNEVDVLDLETLIPSWTEVLSPTSSGQVSNCNSFYADGKPASRHSYYGFTLNEFGDRFMLFGGVPWCSAGGFDNAVASYNIAANTYSPSTSHANLPSAYNTEAAYALNPLTGDVYAAANFNYGRWTRASGTNGTFVVLNPSGSGPKGDSTPSAMDTTRGRILFLGGNNTPRDHHLYTISSNSFSTITLTGAVSGDVSAVGNAVNTALLYVDALDVYLAKLDGPGGTVYQINPTTFSVSQFTTIGGSSIPSTVNGVYNKFRYVPRLRGIIYIPTGNGNAWFLRILP